MTHITGNLLNFPRDINVLIHQANIEGNMGAGIAKSIAQKFPGAAEEDRRAFLNGEAQLGNFSVFLQDDKVIINLYGQSIRRKSSAGIPTDYNAVIAGFQKVARWLSLVEGAHFVIGVPYKMGCALGGGDWGVYSSIIENTIGRQYPVVCVELV